MKRGEKIDVAVCAAGQLISALTERGPLNPAQIRVLIEAAVRHVVPNFVKWELRESVTRILADFEKHVDDEDQSNNSR
jgi:hypothetical protein